MPRTKQSKVRTIEANCQGVVRVVRENLTVLDMKSLNDINKRVMLLEDDILDLLEFGAKID